MISLYKICLLDSPVLSWMRISLGRVQAVEGCQSSVSWCQDPQLGQTPDPTLSAAIISLDLEAQWGIPSTFYSTLIPPSNCSPSPPPPAGL